MRSMIRVGLFVIVAKIVVATREIALAKYYGVGPVVDAYNVALTFSTWLPIMLTSAGAAVLVPVLIRVQKQDKTGHADFIRELNGLVFVCATTLAATTLTFTFLFADDFFGSDGGGMIQQQLLILSPFAGLTFAYYYYSARLQAAGRFIYTAMEALPAAAVIIMIVLFFGQSSLLTLGVGSLVGGVLQIAVLQILLRGQDASVVSFRWSFKSPEWNALLIGASVMIVGQALLSVSGPIDQYFATKIGPGVSSQFGYANRLLGIGLSIATLVVARALLPSLAHLREESPIAAWRQALLWTAITFFVGLAAAAVAWITAPTIVSVVFERGAFGLSDTQDVTRMLRAGLYQIPFFFSGVAAVQWLVVERRFALIAVGCLMAIIAKLISLHFFLPMFGARSLMLSAAVMYGITWAWQLGGVIFTSRREVNGI